MPRLSEELYWYRGKVWHHFSLSEITAKSMLEPQTLSLTDSSLQNKNSVWFYLSLLFPTNAKKWNKVVFTYYCMFICILYLVQISMKKDCIYLSAYFYEYFMNYNAIHIHPHFLNRTIHTNIATSFSMYNYNNKSLNLHLLLQCVGFSCFFLKR